MTLNLQQVDSIGSGTRFTFAGSSEQYIVLEGVTVSSDDADTIDASFNANGILIAGTVLSGFRSR